MYKDHIYFCKQEDENKILFTDKYIVYFWCFALALTLLRHFILWHLPFGLFYDEAQYWYWSKNLDFGYYSKPPMVAWLIAATTSFCGNGIGCTKLASPYIHMITGFAVFLSGRILYNAQIGFWSSVVYLLLPSVTVSSVIISTDPPLLCAWAFSLYYVIKALKMKSYTYWFIAGLTAGLGLLSKYSMVFFLPSLVLYVVFFCSECEKPKIYKGLILATIVAFIVYLPNLHWNIKNGFVSYLHTKDISRLHDTLFHPFSLLNFILGQIGMVGPILFFTAFYIIGKYRKSNRENNTLLLFCFIAPFLGTITCLSLLSKAHANWAAPAYISFTLWITAQLIEKKYYRLLIAICVLHGVLQGIVAGYQPNIFPFSLISEKKYDPFVRVKGWDILAKEVQEIHKQYPLSTLLLDQRKTIAYLMYYLYPKGIDAQKWNNDTVISDHYELTSRMATFPPQHCFLYITQLKEEAKEIISHFKEVEFLKEITIPIHTNYVLRYDVFLLRLME